MKQFYFKSIFLSLLMMVIGVNVTSAAPGDEIKSPDDVVSGKSYYIKGVYTSSGTENSCYYAPTDASGKFTENSVTDINGALPITFTQVEGGWTLTTPNGYYVRPHTSNGQSYLEENEVILQLASGKTKEGEGKGIKIGPYNNYYLQCNTSNPKIGGYRNTQWDVTLIECGDEVSSGASFADTAPSIEFPATNTYSQEVTTAEGYTGTVIYEITANTAGANIDGSTVTVTQAGSVTVKATAEAVEGFLSSTATYTLTVNDTREDNGLEFAESSQEITVGEVLNAPTLTNPNNLTVSYSSSDESIATVDADGNVTGVAVGTARITATFEGNDQYQAGSAFYNITVKKATVLPEGTLLYESVSGYTGTSDVSSELTTNYANLDYDNWASFSKVYAGKVMTGDEDGHLKFGSSSSAGKAVTGSIALTGSGKLTYKVRSYDSKNAGILTVSATGADINGDTEVTGTAEWVEKTVNLTNANGEVVITFETSSDDKRIRVDDIVLVKAEETLDNQYTLVTVEDEGETEYEFDGNTLTKELPASTKFYIKDNSGNKYYGTADDYGVATIFAENHENVPTSATGANFYLRKANTWVFTVAELETTEGITLTVNPETAGETKYMITPSEIAESEDVFDENLRLTKVMTTNGFYLMRSDDYGLFELTAAESNVSEGATQYYIWEFSEQNPTVGFLVNKRINTYRVDKAGTYTFILDTENKTLTAEFISGKQYTLVTSDGTEYPFEGLTLTQKLTGRTVFYIKDNTGKEYYATENTEEAIISAENHENLPTYESGNNFLLKKANTWVFTITELTGADGITLSVNPETAGDTKYMISQSLTEETEDVFDENLQLTKEMDTTPFYIIRSDDYGIFEISANRRTNPEGYARFTFTEDDNTVEFEAGKRLNMYEMSEEGLYTITLNLTNNTVTAEKTSNDLYALVTSVSELSEGDKVIIVNAENAKAISTTQNNNNRGAADVTFDDDDKAIVPSTTDIQVFTLEGDAEGWYFNTGNGYIYAASNSSNHLKTQTERNDNAKAIITIGDGGTSVVFQRSSGDRNDLRYNSSNDIFSCYASASQKPVQIYRLVNEKDVTVTISSVGFATLYYSDRALRVPAGVTAKTYKVANGKLEESKVYETSSVIPAGQAVVLKGAEGDYPFYYTETTGETDSESMLKGSDDDKDTEGGTYYYALQAKKSDGTGGPGFYWMKEDGAVFKNGAHKAYLALENKFGSQEVGGAKSFYLFEEATGIRNVQTDNEAAKEQRFNLSGQRVGSGYKGIVIVNGKKFMKK